jgi:hypothetical protein
MSSLREFERQKILHRISHSQARTAPPLAHLSRRRRHRRHGSIVSELGPSSQVAGIFCQTTVPHADTIYGSTTFNSRLIEPYKGNIESATGRRLEVVANKSINGLMALVEGD